MYNTGDTCPICGCGSLTKEVGSHTFQYKGHKQIIDDYVVFSCPECEESIVSDKSLKESEKILRDFQRKVDGLLTSSEIKKIRVSLGFTQENFSNLLGVGKKSFARYENSTVTQNRSMDHLIRILDHIPRAIDVITPKKENTCDSIGYLEKISYDFKKTHYSKTYKVIGE